jgi:hypothetical protein
MFPSFLSAAHTTAAALEIAAVLRAELSFFIDHSRRRQLSILSQRHYLGRA